MGRQSEIWSLCHHLVAVLLVLVIGVLLTNESSNAQQHYNGPNYACSDAGTVKCDTFALYWAQKDYTDLKSIAALFNTNSTALAALNTLPVDGTLKIGKPAIVPLTCVCSNSTSYANLTHIIAAGDSYSGLNTGTFEFLSTIEAMIDANPTLNYTNLNIGTPISFPARCACPSVAQKGAGVKALVTYPVVPGDSIFQIAKGFGVSQEDISTANELGSQPQIKAYSTLLVPINSSSPNYTGAIFGSATAPAPSSVPGRHSNSKTGGYVVIAVWFLMALSI